MKCSKPLLVVLILLFSLLLSACGTALTEEEQTAFEELLPGAALTDISREVLDNDSYQEKFPAVRKVYATESGDWALISCPVGYNGPLTLAVVIDRQTNAVSGFRIVTHDETRHYVRGMEEDWFTGRFVGKSPDQRLKVVKLEAQADDEIVAITGATVTTQAVVNGVNAALGLYSEAVLGTEQEAVDYAVDFEAASADGPEETGVLAIRAYGIVIGEITLEEIKALPQVERSLVIHSTAGTTNHRFTGTLLANVLDAVDPALREEYDLIMPVGVDDYISGVKMEEVDKENAVYIVYADQGQPLARKDGSEGAMRVIILDDLFGQRFTNYMLEVVLEKDGNPQ